MSPPFSPAQGTGTDASRTPRLEVGSLEAVLHTMEEDESSDKSHWGEMVLIASSKAAQVAPPAANAKAAARK